MFVDFTAECPWWRLVAYDSNRAVVKPYAIGKSRASNNRACR
jgi:hypothetical protein